MEEAVVSGYGANVIINKICESMYLSLAESASKIASCKVAALFLYLRTGK
ncbi:hypothetical protein ACERII_10830 [Evansella sp. AB-rgal1]